MRTMAFKLRISMGACLFFTQALAFPALAADYLPLQVGNRWELRSANVPNPMVFEVTEKTGDVYRVRWDNPWVKAEFQFQDAGNQILLAGLDLGQGVAPMPGGTVYFDFSGSKGKSWQNSLGKISIQDTGHKIETPAGRFENCVLIRALDNKKSATVWGFAPGTGFVQFGEGKGAFYLASFRNSATRETSSRKPEPSRRGAESPSVSAPARGLAANGNRVLIGMDANPSPSEGYTPESMKNRFGMAVRSGVSFHYLHPKWNEIEPKPGKYNFGDVDFKTGLAESHNLPLAINLRIIDTNNRAVPDSYKGWRWDDSKMIDRVTQVLQAMAPRVKGRVKFLSIGNEVDSYFDTHKGEVEAYSRLISAVLPRVRDLFPGAQFSVNFTPRAVPNLKGYLKPLLDLSDVFSITYYPLNADFTMRDPNAPSSDFPAFIAAASGRKVFLQEVGYPSGGANRSSDAAQANFFRSVFRELNAHRGEILAANFVWMSDLPTNVVDDLTKYYRAENSERFKSYLATLGIFDRDGRPKAAWGVFESEAARLQ